MGIIGAAAAGKSALAQLLCAASSVLWDVSRVQCVSMDGYSFPNSYLAAEPGVDHLGRPCTLKDIKGLPRTLDVDKFSSDLRRLHRPNGEAVLLPVYDRDLHDPVQEGVAIVPGCQIVIVEGECFRIFVVLALQPETLEGYPIKGLLQQSFCSQRKSEMRRSLKHNYFQPQGWTIES